MCDCVQKANDALAPHKTRLSGGVMMTGRFVLCVATERTDMNKRKHPMNVFCSYCPFCGEHWPNTDTKEGRKDE